MQQLVVTYIYVDAAILILGRITTVDIWPKCHAYLNALISNAFVPNDQGEMI